MEHLAGKRNLWFAISAFLLVPCVFSLVVWGINFGIDFTGGSAWEVQFDRDVSTESIAQVLADNDHPEATVQQVGSKDEFRYLIRMKAMAEGSPEKAVLTQAIGTLGTLNPNG